MFFKKKKTFTAEAGVSADLFTSLVYYLSELNLLNVVPEPRLPAASKLNLNLGPYLNLVRSSS